MTEKIDEMDIIQKALKRAYLEEIMNNCLPTWLEHLKITDNGNLEPDDVFKNQTIPSSGILGLVRDLRDAKFELWEYKKGLKKGES